MEVWFAPAYSLSRTKEVYAVFTTGNTLERVAVFVLESKGTYYTASLFRSPSGPNGHADAYAASHAGRVTAHLVLRYGGFRVKGRP